MKKIITAVKKFLLKPVLYGSIYTVADAVVLGALIFLVTRC